MNYIKNESKYMLILISIFISSFILVFITWLNFKQTGLGMLFFTLVFVLFQILLFILQYVVLQKSKEYAMNNFYSMNIFVCIFTILFILFFFPQTSGDTIYDKLINPSLNKTIDKVEIFDVTKTLDTKTGNVSNLFKELDKINSDLALIVPTQGIDEYPMWSKDGRKVAINMMGQWYSIDLTKITLQKGVLYNINIGMNNNESSVTVEENIENYIDTKLTDFREIKGKNSDIKITLDQINMSTQLVITRGTNKEIIWTTGLENQHSPILSPDEKFVVFIAELNGLILMRL